MPYLTEDDAKNYARLRLDPKAIQARVETLLEKFDVPLKKLVTPGNGTFSIAVNTIVRRLARANGHERIGTHYRDPVTQPLSLNALHNCEEFGGTPSSHGLFGHTVLGEPGNPALAKDISALTRDDLLSFRDHTRTEVILARAIIEEGKRFTWAQLSPEEIARRKATADAAIAAKEEAKEQNRLRRAQERLEKKNQAALLSPAKPSTPRHRPHGSEHN